MRILPSNNTFLVNFPIGQIHQADLSNFILRTNTGTEEYLVHEQKFV